MTKVSLSPQVSADGCENLLMTFYDQVIECADKIQSVASPSAACRFVLFFFFFFNFISEKIVIIQFFGNTPVFQNMPDLRVFFVIVNSGKQEEKVFLHIFARA